MFLKPGDPAFYPVLFVVGSYPHIIQNESVDATFPLLLAGSISEALGALAELTFIDLSRSQVTGERNELQFHPDLEHRLLNHALVSSLGLQIDATRSCLACWLFGQDLKGKKTVSSFTDIFISGVLDKSTSVMCLTA